MLMEPMRSEWRLRVNALGCAVTAFCSLNFCSLRNPGGLSGAWFLSAAFSLIALILVLKPVNRNRVDYYFCLLTIFLLVLTVFILGERLSDYDYMMQWISDPCLRLQAVPMR